LIDVGAGPITSIGYTHPGVDLDITAIDPLAEEYDELLAEYGITPPVRTISGSAEELLTQFAPGSFDVAHARNCLDHGVDPVRSIRNMVRVVRPGGAVVLRHALREAVTQNYRGLHGWNFESRDGDLVVWRRSSRFSRNVSRRVRDIADGACSMDGYAVVATFWRR
jgi:SAM-dependent methyltransferase